jgi:hypothetical protein
MMLAQGGHVIIGSHPDLNQSLLEKLLERESLSRMDIWFASVRQVVDRCRKVLGYGQIATVRSSNEDHLLLESRYHIADLAVEVWRPGASEPSIATVQLLPGKPRPVGVLPDTLPQL